MGKQFNFHSDEETQKSIVSYILSKNFIIFAKFKKTDELIIIKDLDFYTVNRCKLDNTVYLYKKEFGKLDNVDFFDKYGRLFSNINSKLPVFELTLSRINYESNIVDRGRLYMQKDFVENDEWVSKPDYFNKEYNSLVRQIKKHFNIVEFPCGKHVYKEYMTSEIIDLVDKGMEFGFGDLVIVKLSDCVVKSHIL